MGALRADQLPRDVLPARFMAWIVGPLSMIVTRAFGSRQAPVGLMARVLALLIPALLMTLGSPTSAAKDEAYKTAGALAAYLGVLPAAMVLGHPTGHPERAMHGGVPRGKHDYHIVVAVFEAASARRVEDAEVVATISGLGHVGGTRLRLEPMRLADTVTYGGFVNLPANDRYTIALEIRHPGQDTPVRVDFVFQHRGL